MTIKDCLGGSVRFSPAPKILHSTLSNKIFGYFVLESVRFYSVQEKKFAHSLSADSFDYFKIYLLLILECAKQECVRFLFVHSLSVHSRENYFVPGVKDVG